VFNITGGEIVILLLLALIVLGPDKLPDFIRRAGRVYGELKKMSSGFQSEFRQAIDEPMREMRETANLAKTWFEEGRAETDVMDEEDVNPDVVEDLDEELGEPQRGQQDGETAGDSPFGDVEPLALAETIDDYVEDGDELDEVDDVDAEDDDELEGELDDDLDDDCDDDNAHIEFNTEDVGDGDWDDDEEFDEADDDPNFYDENGKLIDAATLFRRATATDDGHHDSSGESSATA
jgi:sec-independent protein translocase protein TatB